MLRLRRHLSRCETGEEKTLLLSGAHTPAPPLVGRIKAAGFFVYCRVTGAEVILLPKKEAGRMITREWLEEEIEKLNKELINAEERRVKAAFRLHDVQREYNAAADAVNNLNGCIQGLRDELRFLEPEKRAYENSGML
jgi:hypothetical protein